MDESAGFSDSRGITKAHKYIKGVLVTNVLLPGSHQAPYIQIYIQYVHSADSVLGIPGLN